MNSKLIVILLVVVTAVFFFMLFDWTMSAVIHKRKEVMVPSISGKSVVEALDILSRYNLGVKKAAQEHHPDLPPGTVTRQDPPGGMIVREGKIVKVTISQGSELVFVPDIVGETMRRAELIVRKSNLTVGSVTELYSLRYEKDRVVTQKPEPNTIVNKNTEMELVVSLGEPVDGTILMPNFVGESVHDAKIWCEFNLIDYRITEEFQSAPPGTVVHQEPIPDTVLFGTAPVHMVVSKYSAVTGAENREKSFGMPVHYDVPQGGREQKVRMVLMDEQGEREIYSKTHQPGSKIDLTVPTKGIARLRIFINNILVEEKEL